MSYDRPDRVVDEDPLTGRREVYERRSPFARLAGALASLVGGVALLVLLLIVIAIVVLVLLL